MYLDRWTINIYEIIIWNSWKLIDKLLLIVGDVIGLFSWQSL